MPRSKDPRNYGPMYQNLAILMAAGEEEISLEMSGRKAIYIRNNFYAYIQAWAHEADNLHKRKALTEDFVHMRVQEALKYEEAMRGYMVLIDPEAKPELEKVKLRFIRRDIEPRVAEVAEQIANLVEQTGAVEKITRREQAARDVEHALTTGRHAFAAVDGRKVIDEWKSMSEGSVVLEELDTSDVTEEDIVALHADPPDRTDLTDLITDGNQAATIPSDPMKAAFEASEKLRQKEKEESEKTA